VAPSRYRPDVPRWLENLLLRAVARDPKQRFETAEELLLALERGDLQRVSAPQRTPLVHDATSRWQPIALVLLAISLLLLYVLFVR
jgi:protein phosphatase